VSENIKLDDQLAEFTDRLLAGQETTPPAELEAEARMIRRLYGIIKPNADLRPEFRSQLHQQVTEEWEQVQKERDRQWNPIPFKVLSIQRLAAAAVVIIVSAAVVMGILGDGEGTSGTAGSGNISLEMILGGVIAGILIFAAVYAFNRRR
jgi:anti-sigma factor RsiW